MAHAIQHCPPQKKTYELKARQLSYTGNWCWEKSDCGCDEYAVLKQSKAFSVKGKICASQIPSCTPYEIILNLGMKPCAQGWCEPVNLEINVPGKCPITQKVNLSGQVGHCDFNLNLGCFEVPPCACGEITFKLSNSGSCTFMSGLIVKKAIIKPANSC